MIGLSRMIVGAVVGAARCSGAWPGRPRGATGGGSTWRRRGSATTWNTAGMACWSSTSTTATSSSSGSRRPGLNPDGKPDNVKGVCASAATGRIYVGTTKTLTCLDLVTEKVLWERPYEGGCDRMAIAPDGRTIYLPSFEKDHWNVVEALEGSVLARITPKSGSHNTVYGLDGAHAYLAGLKSPLLTVADTSKHEAERTVGPFSAPVRPFTVNGRQTLCFVNVNGLLGFEVGRPGHRQDAPPGRGPGGPGRPGQAARLPEPRDRPDARREGTLGRRRPQPAGPHLRRDRDAAEAGGQPPGPRRAGLDHLHGRRPVRLPLDRRGDRRQDPQGRRHPGRREGRAGDEREDGRGRLPGRPPVPDRRPVRPRPGDVGPAALDKPDLIRDSSTASRRGR